MYGVDNYFQRQHLKTIIEKLIKSSSYLLYNTEYPNISTTLYFLIPLSESRYHTKPSVLKYYIETIFSLYRHRSTLQI